MQQCFRNKFNKLRLNRMSVPGPEVEPDKMSEQPQNTIGINVEHNEEISDPRNDTDNSITATNIQFEQDDDGSQSTCNRVLLSSSASEIPSTKSRPTELFTDRLYISDSDDTNCSIITNDNEDNVLQTASSDIPETETQMKSLQIDTQCKESEQLFSSHDTSSELSLPPATQKYNPYVNSLSHQLNNLSLTHGDQVAPIDKPIINYLTATTILNNSSDDFQFSEEHNQIVVTKPAIINKATILSGTTVPNDSIIDRMLNEDTMKPNESFRDTIISVESSTTEDDDDDYDDEDDSGEDGDNTEIIAVISITDSDEENENEFEPKQTTPQKSPENHPPVSSSLSSTVVQKLDDFFNNIPLIETPNTSVTEQNVDAQNFDESICVNETPEPSLNNSNTQHSNADMEIEKSADTSLNVSATPEPSAESSLATNGDGEPDDKQNAERSNQQAENENEKSQSPNKNANLQLVPSKSTDIKISTPKQKLKGTPTINISAKINIQIHLPEDGSSASESISSKSSGNTSSLSADTNHPPSTEITPEKSQILKTPEPPTSADTNHSPSTDITPEKSQFLKTPEPSISARQTRSSAKKLLAASGGNKTPITPEQNLQSNRMEISPSPKRTLFKTPMMDDKAKKLTPKPRRSEIDPDAQAILNALYGKAWQTPQLLEKCSGKKATERQRPLTEVKRRIQKPKQRDSFANDFCDFRKNVPTDLESTRIGTIAQNIQPNKKIMEKPIVLSPHFKKPDKSLPAANDSDDFQIKRSNKKKPVTYKIIDDDLSDSNSDNDFYNESDESSYSSKNKSIICDSSCTSSESEKENNRTRRQVKKKSSKPTKTKVVKGKKEKSFADKLVYLDLTNIEADIDPDHDSPNATEVELVQITKKLFDIDTLLGSCEFKKKSYQPNAVSSKEECTPLPQPKTKRKLFTPRHYDDRDDNDDENDNANNSNHKSSETNEISPDVSEINVNPKLLIPINRHLESIKRTEIQRPKLPSSLLQTPTQTSSLPIPKKPVSTPKTPTLSNGTNSNKKLPTIAIDSFFSTHKTFGFLHSLDHRILKEFCHPDALRYRNNFKTNREELTDYLYHLYNSKVFDNKLNVPILWNKKLLKTAGRCLSRKRQGVLSCTIELSDKVVTSADRLRCTLIHEMCHAASWIFDESTGHGVKWRNWAQRANNVFEEIPTIKVCHQYDIQYKYVYKCTLCNAKSNSHTKSRKVEFIRCAYCHGPIEILLNKKGKDGQTIQTPVPIREPSGFAKFVKEKYKDFRLPGVKHADVMKLLSNAFAEVKCANK